MKIFNEIFIRLKKINTNFYLKLFKWKTKLKYLIIIKVDSNSGTHILQILQIFEKKICPFYSGYLANQKSYPFLVIFIWDTFTIFWEIFTPVQFVGKNEI